MVRSWEGSLSLSHAILPRVSSCSSRGNDPGLVRVLGKKPYVGHQNALDPSSNSVQDKTAALFRLRDQGHRVFGRMVILRDEEECDHKACSCSLDGWVSKLPGWFVVDGGTMMESVCSGVGLIGKITSGILADAGVTASACKYRVGSERAWVPVSPLCKMYHLSNSTSRSTLL